MTIASVEEGIASQTRNIESDYGKPIGAWIELVSASGLTKHAQIVAMLKAEHGMRHGAAHPTAIPGATRGELVQRTLARAHQYVALRKNADADTLRARSARQATRLTDGTTRVGASCTTCEPGPPPSRSGGNWP